MQDLIKQEQFELEVLAKLNSAKLLSNLVFCGGTMLRACFGLDRFSVDLDFWVKKKIGAQALYKKIKEALGKSYRLTDCANKVNTLLFEFKSANYPRSMKLEIRKERKKMNIEQAIAYSRYSNTQVFLNVVTLSDMMAAKIEAFLDRKEIRDIFDIEFLLKRGIKLDAPVDKLERLLKGILALKKSDYAVKLGSLLETQERKYYLRENFKILRLAINEKITGATND
jgi:predicted nucleotidyltransferase component of viral defense system